MNENTVIAERKSGLGFMYCAYIVLGILLPLSSANAKGAEFFMIVFGAIIMILGAVNAVKYFRIPRVIISMDETGTLYLPHGVTVAPADITDVSYRPARSKHSTLKWGEVIISTRYGTYKLDFVAECEDVSKALTKLMYAYKEKS